MAVERGERTLFRIFVNRYSFDRSSMFAWIARIQAVGASPPTPSASSFRLCREVGKQLNVSLL